MLRLNAVPTPNAAPGMDSGRGAAEKKAVTTVLVVVAYNPGDHESITKATDNTLYHLFLHTAEPFSVILAYHGSIQPGGSMEELMARYAKFSNFHLAIDHEKEDLVDGANLGLEKAAELGPFDYVGMLANDIIVPSRWNKDLIEVVEKNDGSVGMVAPVFSSVFQQYQHWNQYVLYHPCARQTVGSPDRGLLQPFCPPPTAHFGGDVSFTLTLIPWKVFETIGFYDTALKCHCLDIDYEWRIWASGYKIVIVPSVKVIHYHRATVSPDLYPAHGEYSENEDYLEFFKKWGNVKPGQIHVKDLPGLAKKRGVCLYNDGAYIPRNRPPKKT